LTPSSSPVVLCRIGGVWEPVVAGGVDVEAELLAELVGGPAGVVGGVTHQGLGPVEPPRWSDPGQPVDPLDLPDPGVDLGVVS
jgi:hypothetical protein